MSESKNMGVFIALDLIFLVIFLELIPIVFNLGKRAFIAELLLMIVFMAVVLVLMFSLFFSIEWAFLGFLLFFSAHLLNTLFLYFTYRFDILNAMVLAGLGLLGLIISVVKINYGGKVFEEQLTLDDDFDKPIPDNVKIIPEEEFDVVDKKPQKPAQKRKKLKKKK